MRPQSAQKRRRQAQLEMPSKWLSPLSDNRPGRPVRGDRRGMVAGKTRFVYLRAGSCKPAEGYCTLAVTEAAPFRVKVHVFVLLPPLEHAPDQITSRPFVALSVIEGPTVNEPGPLGPEGDGGGAAAARGDADAGRGRADPLAATAGGRHAERCALATAAGRCGR